MPIILEEGKGYSLMEGYKVPPIMFLESEANALITIEQLVLKNNDSSLIKEYSKALQKIKAVLQYSTKDKIELLSERVGVSPAIPNNNPCSSWVMIQKALTNFQVLTITYRGKENTTRQIEPFAFYYTLEANWTLIAYCRLRKDYRMFRLYRILTNLQADSFFSPHKHTLQEFLAKKEKKFKASDIPLS